ncbi:GGDEF domain-containing protein [Rheinheimera texasensis]|uniref:GGDEF domain-containing protein n=1 Tax=Rheinheimera texasensis TaxID=306205 RepID=UPI00068C11A1|nr:GGDEF domain-containing protein [Rheinheimera texasensis]
MDSYTLMITTCLTAATMALTFFGLAAASRRETYLIMWGCAGLMFLCNSVLACIAFHVQLPYLLAPGFANTCTVLGYLFLLLGLRLYLRLAIQLYWLPLLATLTYAVNLLPWTQIDVSHRILLNFPILFGLQTIIVLLLFRHRQPQLKKAYTALALVFILNAAQMAARWCYLLVDDTPGLTFLGSQLVQTLGRLAMFVFVLMATFACALLVIRRQELVLREHSDKDPLTGCYNRRALQRLLDQIEQRRPPQPQPLSLIIFDVDHFKHINDNFGHACGDQVLAELCLSIQQELRSTDLLFRLGGEEFAVALPNTQLHVASQIAERLRQRALALKLSQQPDCRISISLGVSAGFTNTRPWTELLKQADSALYQAKHLGRNQTLCYAETNC